MTLFNVELIHQDGTEELITAVDDMTVKDGMLHLWFRGYNMSFRYDEHRGSYPLVGIRRYRIVE